MELNHHPQQQDDEDRKPAAVLPHDVSLEPSATHTDTTTTSELFASEDQVPPPRIGVVTKTVSRRRKCRNSTLLLKWLADRPTGLPTYLPISVVINCILLCNSFLFSMTFCFLHFHCSFIPLFKLLVDSLGGRNL